MRRRGFITFVLCMAAAAPCARAQQSAMPVIGFVSSLSAISSRHSPGLLEGLSESGFVEGSNVTIEYRWANGDYDRLPALVAELVDRQVDVIFAAALPAAKAAKDATRTIPIVFLSGGDPVKFGLVASLNQPGGNATGVFQYFGPLGGKRLELLRELLPKAGTIAVLSNPSNPNAEVHLGDIEAAARAMGQPIHILRASTESDIDGAFATLARDGDLALLVADDPLFSTQRTQILALAARYAVPAIYYTREFPASGGLISYGSSIRHLYRQAGIYVGRTLKGEKPADLPVLQPTTFELVINLNTANALGLAVAPTLLARADEVIE